VVAFPRFSFLFLFSCVFCVCLWLFVRLCGLFCFGRSVLFFIFVGLPLSFGVCTKNKLQNQKSVVKRFVNERNVQEEEENK
jgi:hypothetical protein